MRTVFLSFISMLIACSFPLAGRAFADGRPEISMEARGGMISHHKRSRHIDMQGVRVMPRFSYGTRLRLHIGPILGATRGSLGMRDTIHRSISTQGLKDRLNSATDLEARTFTVPTGVLSDIDGVPDAVSVTFDPPGYSGAEIPDSIRLTLPYSATMDIPWTPVAGFRTSLELMPDTRFRFELFTEYEHSVGRVEAQLRSIVVDFAAVGVDLSSMRNAFEVTGSWSIMTAGVRLGWMFDRWRPYADLGLLCIREHHRIEVQGTLSKALRRADIDTSITQSAMWVRPFYTLGSEIDLSSFVYLRVEGAIAPGPRSNTLFLNGGLGFRLWP